MIELLYMLFAGAILILGILCICGVLLTGIVCVSNVLDGYHPLINMIVAIICFLILSFILGVAIGGV